MPYTPLARAVPELVDAAGRWQALGQLGARAGLLCVPVSLQQLAVAFRVLSWCKLGRAGDGEMISVNGTQRGGTEEQGSCALLRGFGRGEEGGVFEGISGGSGSWESPRQVEMSGCQSLCGLLPLPQVHVVALVLGLPVTSSFLLFLIRDCKSPHT